MRLTLTRTLSDDEGTVGVLSYRGEEICRIGELPWRDNKPNYSHIPAGVYRVEYMERSGSGKYRDVYHVLGTDPRQGVLIHPGNWTGDTNKGLRSDSHGCLLPGMRVGRLAGQRAMLASKGAIARIHAITGRLGFELEITNA